MSPHNVLNNSSKAVFIESLIAQKYTKCTNLTLWGNRVFIHVIIEKLFDFFPFVTPFCPYIMFFFFFFFESALFHEK